MMYDGTKNIGKIIKVDPEYLLELKRNPLLTVENAEFLQLNIDEI